MNPEDPGGRPAPHSSPDDSLTHGNERYASMFTHHPHATYSVDGRGYFTDANARSLEMTGLSLEEMRRTHFSRVIHPDDVHLFETAFAATMAGEPQVIEGHVVRADGEVIDIRCTAIPLVVRGEIVGVHGVTEDVTEANRVLCQLEEANAAKTLFLATVSHEIRTPLAVVTGAAELLLGTELGPEAEHYAAMVHRSSDRLMRLADEILEYSGLEAHQTVLHPRTFDVRELVADVAEWAELFVERRDPTISFGVDDSVPSAVVGDRRRIAQILTNLVHNAVRFTDHGGIDVRVRSRPATADGADGDRDGVAWIEFVVTDSGIGVAPEHAQALFEPFMQVSPHAAGDRQGIGLGLAIARSLADLMGGRLRVSSTLGEGSTFTFEVLLPRAVAEEAGGPSAGG